MNKNPMYKIYDFYFFKLREKFSEKQHTKYFLVSKNNVSQCIDI